MQRRQHSRYRLWFPLQVQGPEIDGMAVNQNISAGGMLIAVSAKLEEGAVVSVRFQLPPGSGAEYTLSGHIVRIEENSADPEGMWPYRIAVAFDDVEDELVPVLERAARDL